MTHPNSNPKSCSKYCKMPKSNFLFLGVTFMVWGDILKWLTLTPTLKVVPNVGKCLNPTFHIWVWHLWLGGYAEMTHPNPNPKNFSKCYKMPKSNFLFLGAMFMVGGYAEMTHPNPKSFSKCWKMPKSNFLFLGVTCLVGGMLKILHPTLTLKVFFQMSIWNWNSQVAFSGIK